VFFRVPQALLSTAISFGAAAQKAQLPFGGNAFQEDRPGAFLMEQVARVT
jgi:hypothetical protein